MHKITARTYPSTMSLRCFEASARFLSFTKAAQVLHMTQSAVSKQVAHLEDNLNTCLFERTLKGLALTPTGKLFLQQTQLILNKIEISVLNILAYGSEAEAVNIAAHPTLCARWLIQILKGFGQQHPQIHLDIQEQITSTEIENQQTDIAFLYGEGIWRDMTSVKLFEERCVAVCSPELIPQAFSHLEDFCCHVLIQSRSRPRAWDEYFQSQGFINEQPFIGPRFDTFYSCINAAITGCGIALIPKFLVEKELDSGELILAWSYEMNSHNAYYMTYPTSMAKIPKVATVVHWIQNHLHSTPTPPTHSASL
ncbi:LysR substrate-binding domain-containing protein [Acinetobacter larvae]|uniref:LysR family transcriptional regulator n=1 Tax=Acinetobacter larvae TaxID=1789224 RepID=A0A1B2LZL7_9GAMM|nr:LysR substrate-binding domain-containing protein [Acinetobacter larvae]AOA58386.1 LysR family transcriptional regulator [Acinetobacter larvae]